MTFTESSTRLFTYADAIERLQQYAGGLPLQAQHAQVYGAIQDAYDYISSLHEWEYLLTERRFQLQAPYSTGTIEYTQSNRTAAISGGSWPTWAKYGRILVGSVACPVQSVSGSNAVLDPYVNFGENLAAGTTYKLIRTEYPFDHDFHKMYDLLDEDEYWSNTYVTPDHWKRLERGDPNSSSGDPFYWTIFGDPDVPGAWTMRVHGYPSAHETLDYIMLRLPRQMRYTGFHESLDRVGTVAVSSTTVTGTGTAFESGMIGSVIRFGSTTDHPTGLGGLAPYKEQRIVTAVGSATSLTISSALTGTYGAGTKYVITDPVDLHYTLRVAFTRCCEWMFGIVANTQRTAGAQDKFFEALRYAMESGANILKPVHRSRWAEVPWWLHAKVTPD